jgi:hypothetical protein
MSIVRFSGRVSKKVTEAAVARLTTTSEGTAREATSTPDNTLKNRSPKRLPNRLPRLP